jgi:hypothetical protein
LLRIAGGDLSSLFSPDCPLGSDLRTRNFSHDFPPASFFWTSSQPARLRGCVAEKVAGNNTTRRRFRVAADVPVLWADHAAPRNVLSGVRQVSQTSLIALPARAHLEILESGSTMKCAANEQSCSALRIGMKQNHESSIPGNSGRKLSTRPKLWGVLTIRKGERTCFGRFSLF